MISSPEKIFTAIFPLPCDEKCTGVVYLCNTLYFNVGALEFLKSLRFYLAFLKADVKQADENKL